MRLIGLAVIVTLSLGLATLATEAQQAGKVPRIGWLAAGSAASTMPLTDAFRQGLRQLGYVEGKDIVIEYRYAEGKIDRLPALAAELVRLKVDVIVTAGAASTRPAREATATNRHDV